MSVSSPLRYPGGKSSLAGLMSQICRTNDLGDREIVEPFAGGAGLSLTMLFRGEVGKIHINDADPAIHDFWWSVIYRPQQFLELLLQTPVSVSTWRRQRALYRARGRVSRLHRGFAAFYLNRCNRSGIIRAGGPIGGIAQQGRWKIDSRYNRLELQRRCEKISEYRDCISVSGRDGIDILERYNPDTSFFFIDPPYVGKGKTLYWHIDEKQYPVALSSCLRSMRNDAWILTYDDCPEVRKLYQDWASIRPFTMRYTAAKRRNGQEVLIAPKWMCLPAKIGRLCEYN